MFKKNNNNPQPQYNQGYYNEPLVQRLNYQLEETEHKLRNLNNRLRRLENYLGLRIDDKFDDDVFSNDQF